MQQLELSLSRRSDPATSHAAAESAKAFKARQIAKIWNALKWDAEYLAGNGMTYREIAKRTGLEPVSVGRRLAEMERNKLIAYTGEVRDKCRVMRALADAA